MFVMPASSIDRRRILYAYFLINARLFRDFFAGERSSLNVSSNTWWSRFSIDQCILLMLPSFSAVRVRSDIIAVHWMSFPVPSAGERSGKDVQCTALISDLILTAEELGSIKRMHWSIENRLHHVLDDTFREDRSPARKSRNNLALIRKFAYNILRLAMYETGLTMIMTEMMDCFCDNGALREQYVFQGIASLY